MTKQNSSSSPSSSSSILISLLALFHHSPSCQSFQPQPHQLSYRQNHPHSQRHKRQRHLTIGQNQRYSQRSLASISAEYDGQSEGSSTIISSVNAFDKGDISLGEKVRTVTVAYIDQLAKTQFNQDDDEDDLESSVDSSSMDSSTATATTSKRERIVLDVINGRPTFTYQIELPIVGITPQAIGDETNVMTTSVDLSQTVGLTLNQIQFDRESFDSTMLLGEAGLEMDTLRYVSLEEQLVTDQKLGLKTSFEENDVDGSIQIFNEKKERDALISTSSTAFSGVVVSRIVRGGIAWKAGVRAGDRIIATSATVGDKIWPKSTLDGVRSSISSRKVMSSTINFQLQRSCDNLISEAEVVQEFEMSLSRPMGIHIEDTTDGYVQISGFTDEAPKLVTDKLQVGDRIIAVDSSLGNKLWPISNVEGAVSAVTTRLPGQAVRLRFERAIEKGTDLSTLQSLTESNREKSLAEDLLSNYSKFQSSAVSTSSATTTSKATNNEDLLGRCRDVLKRYIYVYDPSTERSPGVPALVADRVLESLAATSASLDAKTLSLVMNAYTLCNQPREALRIFEGAVGLAADGSSRDIDEKITAKNGGEIVRSSYGLNLYTATNLIRAHSQLGDAASARRILSCIEGDEININGITASNWGAKFKPDTKCYNTVLAAISSSKNFGIEAAEEIYETMCDPVLFNTPRPKKNVVSYNTMISAYARCGKRKDAFGLLNEMLDQGLKPDKYTITSLVKVVVEDGDIDTALNLLSDMKKAGIKADAVGYNTVIRSLCDKSQWFEAKTLVADMESRGIKPDSKTYGLLMNGLLKLNKPGPCLTLFESACSDQTTAALMENVQLYTTAITAAATLGDYERALELVSRMTLAGVKPNIKTLTALIGACLSGGNHNYALDVFNKINKPDGYATLLGIRAHCEVGNFERAIKMVDGNVLMSGKQTMSSYNYIIKTALKSKNYAIAKEALDNLLKNNFIPSKITFKNILEPLGLLQKKKRQKLNEEDAEAGEEDRFKYLLSIIDSIEPRKLQCTGQLYSIILQEGARNGRLFKKIASLLQKSRAASVQIEMEVGVGERKEQGTKMTKSSWVNLFENYASYKDKLNETELPQVRVRINQKEIRSVLFAEQNVTYNARRKGHKRTPTR